MAVPGPISTAPAAHLLSVNASRKRAFIKELLRIRPEICSGHERF